MSGYTMAWILFAFGRLSFLAMCLSVVCGVIAVITGIIGITDDEPKCRQAFRWTAPMAIAFLLLSFVPSAENLYESRKAMLKFELGTIEKECPVCPTCPEVKK